MVQCGMVHGVVWHGVWCGILAGREHTMASSSAWAERHGAMPSLGAEACVLPGESCADSSATVSCSGAGGNTASTSRHRHGVQEEHEKGLCVGLDVSTGEPADPHMGGILDNYIVKRQILQRWVGRYLLILQGTRGAGKGG